VAVLARPSQAVHRGSPETAFGRAHHAFRKRRSLSQEQLAFVSGYDRTYISLLERGEKALIEDDLQSGYKP
jgi:hypothetical protein